MKKILIFNDYYYPSKNCGGPITSIENIVNSCFEEFEFYIVCYNHDFNDNTAFSFNTNQWYQVGNAKVMYVENGYLDFSISKMKNLLLSLKPNLIWYSGVLTPNNKIVSLICSRKLKIPILFSPRGEVSADRVKLKAYKKVPYLNVLKYFKIYKGCYFHATSDDEFDGIKKYFSPDDKHVFKIPNIAINIQQELSKNKKNKDELKIIFFSRIHEIKNLLFAINCIAKCKKRITYDIYGPIESKDYWDKCKKIMETLPQNIKVEYKGMIDHSEMAKVIQSYDCFLFPTINENYGHVIAETLANHRPVIISKGTTPWDDLDNKAGFVIDLSDQEEFTKRVDYLASLDNEEYDEIIIATKKYFSNKILENGAIEGHKKMLRDIIKNYEME